MSELALAFPPWSPSRILSEAVNEYKLLHADNQLDESSNWAAICGAVVAMLRHRFSNYNDVVSENNRERLQAEILAAAKRQFPWLRPEMNPILTRALGSRFDKRLGEKYLDYLSRGDSCMADRVG